MMMLGENETKHELNLLFWYWHGHYVWLVKSKMRVVNDLALH